MKSFEKKHVKGSKIFLKKKKKKKRLYHRECNKNLSDEKTENKVGYVGNYYFNA